jgi:8-oxo-dGTP pyrophosphatase MutT (NUDIX family)
VEGRRYIVNVEAFVFHSGRYLMIVRGATEEIAPNTLTPPGGKVDVAGLVPDVLEKTLRREVLEETGVEVEDPILYVESHSFDAADATIVDLVFLARYARGEAQAADPQEVAAIEWLTYDEVMGDARSMPWTRESLRRAEAVRRAQGW